MSETLNVPQSSWDLISICHVNQMYKTYHNWYKQLFIYNHNRDRNWMTSLHFYLLRNAKNTLRMNEKGSSKILFIPVYLKNVKKIFMFNLKQYSPSIFNIKIILSTLINCKTQLIQLCLIMDLILMWNQNQLILPSLIQNHLVLTFINSKLANPTMINSKPVNPG